PVFSICSVVSVFTICSVVSIFAICSVVSVFAIFTVVSVFAIFTVVSVFAIFTVVSVFAIAWFLFYFIHNYSTSDCHLIPSLIYYCIRYFIFPWLFCVDLTRNLNIIRYITINVIFCSCTWILYVSPTSSSIGLSPFSVITGSVMSSSVSSSTVTVVITLSSGGVQATVKSIGD